MELDLAPVSLPDLLEHGVAMVRERAARPRHLARAATSTPEVGIVRADELKLKQVVAQPAHQRRQVHARRRRRSTVTARRVGRRGAASPSATPASASPRRSRSAIFEAFQRGGRGGADQHGGHRPRPHAVASGSSSCTAAACGWRAELGVGSTFAFAIPTLARAEPARPAAPSRRAPVARGRGAPGSVLVVEDDRRSADLLRVYLEGAGYAVVVARDGVEGLELARRLAPGGGDPRHPAAAARRLGPAGAAQGRPRDGRRSRS